jgi:hypothetical protein
LDVKAELPQDIIGMIDALNGTSLNLGVSSE